MNNTHEEVDKIEIRRKLKKAHDELVELATQDIQRFINHNMAKGFSMGIKLGIAVGLMVGIMIGLIFWK